MSLALLSAGAAKGLVKSFETQFGVQGQFGAVGAMREAFDRGAPCDVLILTASMIDALIAQGYLMAHTRASLGLVRTGIAVRTQDPRPDVSTPQALRNALLAADAIYLPDPERATAGIHFAKVMHALGVAEAVKGRLHPYPNGATAMQTMSTCAAQRPIGCTQHTEILYTSGVHLIGPLPAPHGLATEYALAVSSRAANVEGAAGFVKALSGPEARALRELGGFEA